MRLLFRERYLQQRPSPQRTARLTWDARRARFRNASGNNAADAVASLEKDGGTSVVAPPIAN